MTRPFRLVYCITLYTFPQLLSAMFTLIYRPEHYYIVHVDKKAPRPVHDAARELAQRYPNVHIMPSQTVWWGHWDIMETHLRSMATALALPDDWDYWLNITGQDFPAASQETIVDFLSQQPDACYLGLHPVDHWTLIHHNRVRYQHWLWRQFIVRLPLRRSALPDKRMPYLGSTYMILPRAACHWLLNDPGATALVDYFKTVPCADEYYPQTALMNGPWASKVVNENRRGIVWHDGKPGPLVISSDTLGEALQYDPFFVRKVSPDTDVSVFAELEKRCTIQHERV